MDSKKFAVKLNPEWAAYPRSVEATQLVGGTIAVSPAGGVFAIVDSLKRVAASAQKFEIQGLPEGWQEISFSEAYEIGVKAVERLNAEGA